MSLQAKLFSNFLLTRIGLPFFFHSLSFETKQSIEKEN